MVILMAFLLDGQTFGYQFGVIVGIVEESEAAFFFFALHIFD